MRWPGCITDWMALSLSKLLEMVKDREAWHAAVRAVANSRTQPSDWTTATKMLILHPDLPSLFVSTIMVLRAAQSKTSGVLSLTRPSSSSARLPPSPLLTPNPSLKSVECASKVNLSSFRLSPFSYHWCGPGHHLPSLQVQVTVIGPLARRQSGSQQVRTLTLVFGCLSS